MAVGLMNGSRLDRPALWRLDVRGEGIVGGGISSGELPGSACARNGTWQSFLSLAMR